MPLNVGLPVGEYHAGNTSDYVKSALEALGHSSSILTSAQFFESFASGAFDIYLCIDSGEPVDLRKLGDVSLERVGYWFIDFRHHKESPKRSPNDLELASFLQQHGGWIFQAQHEDHEYCAARGLTNSSWIPLAADPEVWCDQPAFDKMFHVGFAGNVWDEGRARALTLLMKTPGLRFGFKGHGGAWKEDGAALLRHSLAGFNISSWYGSEHAFDVNMRVFETLSCGIPLITNSVPSLKTIFPENASYIRTYSNLEELVPVVQRALDDPGFLASGTSARRFIVENATYQHRVEQIIDKMLAP